MKKIAIIYEDEQLVVFDKPSGMLVIPAPGKEKRTLTNLVNDQCDLSGVSLYPCHRLDQQTSGAIIYAKGKKNQKLMREVFEGQEIDKTYVAFVKGRLDQASGTLCFAIKDFYQKKYAKQSRAKFAETRYRVIQQKKGFAILEVNPKTGRTNQIRIHFAEMGHPLLGERVYAFRKDFVVDMKRLALHCQKLNFNNPVTGKKINVVCDLPEDMAKFISKG